jgi:hypothetical protein
VQLFAALRRAGQVDIAVSFFYVVVLGTVGLLMVRESLRAIIRRRRTGVAASRAGEHTWLHGLPFKMRFRKSRLYMSVLPPVAIGGPMGHLVHEVLGRGDLDAGKEAVPTRRLHESRTREDHVHDKSINLDGAARARLPVDPCAGQRHRPGLAAPRQRRDLSPPALGRALERAEGVRHALPVRHRDHEGAVDGGVGRGRGGVGREGHHVLWTLGESKGFNVHKERVELQRKRNPSGIRRILSSSLNVC